MGPKVSSVQIRGRRVILTERRRLRRRYRGLYDQLTRILFDHDPIHIAATPDEYEPEVGQILTRSERVGSVSELTDVIHSVFVEMFDASIAGPRSRYEGIARALWKPLCYPAVRRDRSGKGGLG